MDPSIFSVSISMLVFGFTVGLSVDSLLTRYYLEKMQGAVQKGITTCLEKDKQIDQLKTENKMLKDNYERLYDATSYMTVAYKKLINLPAPGELYRTETYFVNEESDEEVDVYQTPTCEKSKMD